jgi:D-alanyl-D-alanine carboxypeptidase (penicillin-binding protein 5/6)
VINFASLNSHNQGTSTMLSKLTASKFLSVIALSAITSTLMINSFANPVIPIPTQPQVSISPSMPTLTASGYILMDANTGKIIAEKNSNARLAPASLTKLMTMYVISNALKNGSIHLDDKVRVSSKAWQTSGSRMFIKVNDEVPVRELLKGIVIASGNDASVAMAEYLAGTEETFANVMNQQAKTIGMNNSNFVDSNGLPNANHYSTAHDLALLAQAIIKNFPEDYRLYSEKWFAYNNIKQPNRNRLLWRFSYADGLKTGHTDEAGYCLVGSAMKDGTRLISVVMGEPSDSARTEDSIRLLTYGFRFFETHKLYNGDTKLAVARVWKGKNSEVNLGVAKDFYLTMPAGQYKNIQATLVVNDLKAPIVKGQPYGTLNITLNNQVLASEPLVALSDDPKGGFFRSISDSINFTFHKLFSRSNEKMNNG